MTIEKDGVLSYGDKLFLSLLMAFGCGAAIALVGYAATQVFGEVFSFQRLLVGTALAGPMLVVRDLVTGKLTMPRFAAIAMYTVFLAIGAFWGSSIVLLAT